MYTLLINVILCIQCCSQLVVRAICYFRPQPLAEQEWMIDEDYRRMAEMMSDNGDASQSEKRHDVAAAMKEWEEICESFDKANSSYSTPKQALQQKIA
ncbi:MAG: hypothetical protein Q4P66_08140 [Actinomycetaceae bacterium]|nr:hypothetical protein [Actinomycetaceae bacterium]